jgi:hypothetical protein
VASKIVPRTSPAANSTCLPQHRLSDDEKMEFFLTMIEELRNLAEQANYQALSRQLSLAVEALTIDGEKARENRLRSLC